MEKSSQSRTEKVTWFNVSNHKEPPNKSEIAGKIPSLELRPEVDLRQALEKGYRVIINKGRNRFLMFRYLLGRYKYDPEGLHLDDYLVMLELYYSLIEKEEETFQGNRKKLLDENLIELIGHLVKVKTFPSIPRDDATKAKLEKVDIIPSGNAYFGQKGQGYTSKGYRLVFNARVTHQKFPPKAYIGVGYKDKGSRRDSAYNGSPSWQEIATHESNLEREGLENPGTSSEKSEGEA